LLKHEHALKKKLFAVISWQYWDRGMLSELRYTGLSLGAFEETYSNCDSTTAGIPNSIISPEL
jgi:hypothetical protein